jgi:putative transposase
VTVSREGLHWYASLQLGLKVKAPVPPDLAAADVVGLDRGTLQPFVLSTGEVLGRTIETEAVRRKERRLGRTLARTQRGSKRRTKAIARLRAHKARQTRRRRDMLHQASVRIARDVRVLVLEALKVAAMTGTARGTANAPGTRVSQKAGLNRAILDKGWGEFARQARYKLAWAGGQILEVPSAHTSQTCAMCNYVNAGSRARRDLFVCLACGHTDCADHNAAVEIRRRGLRLLGLAETREPHGSDLDITQDEPRPEWSWQPGEPSAQAWRKREEKSDGSHDPALAEA